MQRLGERAKQRKGVIRSEGFALFKVAFGDVQLVAHVREARQPHRLATASSNHHHYRVARTSRPLQMYAGETFGQGIDMMGDTQIDAKRAAALHDCSVTALRYNFSTWQIAQLASFGTCMVEHGETPSPEAELDKKGPPGTFFPAGPSRNHRA
jgi:hypothetical protein